MEKTVFLPGVATVVVIGWVVSESENGDGVVYAFGAVSDENLAM